jgi:hypothetical protein
MSSLTALEDPLAERSYFVRRGVEDSTAPALDFSCHICRTPFTWQDWFDVQDRMRVVCPSCGAQAFSAEPAFPAPEATQRKVETPDYLHTRWFHASVSNSWASDVSEAEEELLLVHAGSELSALSRADDLARRTKCSSTLYLHSFTLSNVRRFAPILLEDAETSWQTRLDEPREMSACPGDAPVELSKEGYHGAPYYNRYELPGEVSILFHSKLISLSTVETVVLYRP